MEISTRKRQTITARIPSYNPMTFGQLDAIGTLRNTSEKQKHTHAKVQPSIDTFKIAVRVSDASLHRLYGFPLYEGPDCLNAIGLYEGTRAIIIYPLTADNSNGTQQYFISLRSLYLVILNRSNIKCQSFE